MKDKQLYFKYVKYQRIRNTGHFDSFFIFLGTYEGILKINFLFNIPQCLCINALEIAVAVQTKYLTRQAKNKLKGKAAEPINSRKTVKTRHLWFIC